MKERIEEITQLVDQLMDLAAGFERGHVISWELIEAIAGDRVDVRPQHIIRRWRRMLERDRSIVTLVENGVGVRLLTHSQTAEEIPRMRQKKAYRQLRKAVRQTNTVNLGQLSTFQRRTLMAQRQNMAETRRELFRSQKEARIATETLPLRKMPT